MSESSPPRTLAPGRLHRIIRKRAAEEAAMEWSAIDIEDDEVDPTMVTVPAAAEDLARYQAPPLSTRIEVA